LVRKQASKTLLVENSKRAALTIEAMSDLSNTSKNIESFLIKLVEELMKDLNLN